jgi:DNA adenine methylase
MEFQMSGKQSKPRRSRRNMLNSPNHKKEENKNEEVQKQDKDENENYRNITVIPILKADEDEKKVTGVVLEPDTFDAQKTIIKEKVITKAAEKFLSDYNKATKLGLQHKSFKKKFDLLQSYIAPMDFSIKDKIVKKGSWIIIVKVLDNEIWKKIKKGEITGFSIGGKAKVKKSEKDAA